MNSTELIEAVRQTAFIGDATLFPDFTDARIRTELTDAMLTTFGRAIVAARQGYWLRRDFRDVGAGTVRVRVPPRALVIEQVAIAPTATASATSDASTVGSYTKLQEVTETHAEDYEPPRGNTGDVLKYAIRSDQIYLLPPPATTVSIRITYYMRPSRIVAPQTTGAITAIDTTLRTVTVAALPLDQDTATPITSNTRIDIVHPDGWHELAMWNKAQGITGVGPFTITLGGSDDMSEIRTGDYVRAAEQSEWPALPDDFHRPLAEVAATKVMSQLNMLEKASFQKSLTDGDIARFYDLIQPRVRAEAPVLKAPVSVLTAGRSRRGFYGWR